MTGTLAQTIQGEASTPEGQFAVAATIYNRMRAGNFPGGKDPHAIVNAPQQYVGYAATPSSTATALAQAIENGTLEHFGDPGNAVNFQSGPTAQANGLTAGTNIGGNWFSDRFGAPTADFKPPVFGSHDIADAPTVDGEGMFTLTDTGMPGAIGAGRGATKADGSLGSKAGKGQEVTLGVQPSLYKDITDWITGIAKGLWSGTWTAVGSAFLNVQNWFIRAFIIIVGIVLLAIGLIKLSGHDVGDVVVNMGKRIAPKV